MRAETVLSHGGGAGMFRATVGDGEPHARFRAEVPRSVATTPTVHRARAEVPRSPPVGGEEKEKRVASASNSANGVRVRHVTADVPDILPDSNPKQIQTKSR